MFTTTNSPNAELMVNANARDASGAPVFTDAQIDGALADRGDLIVAILPGDEAELDCAARPNPSPPPEFIAALSYCSPGGTGRAYNGDVQQPFPGTPGGAFDPDHDGFGTLTTQLGSDPGLFHLSHGATTDEIKTGDLLIERVTTNGVEGEFPATVPEVLTAVSALASYDEDGPGPKQAIPVPYPVQSEFRITEHDGNLDLTVSLWRPQRRPTPSEPGYADPPTAWTDVGGLSYQTVLGGPDWGAGNMACPNDSLSSLDPQLTPASLPGSVDQVGGFIDTRDPADQPASPDATLTYSIDITKCIALLNAELAQRGAAQTLSWPAGASRPLTFKARDYGNRVQSAATVLFKRQ
jgi:hypothetical protein